VVLRRALLPAAAAIVFVPPHINAATATVRLSRPALPGRAREPLPKQVEIGQVDVNVAVEIETRAVNSRLATRAGKADAELRVVEQIHVAVGIKVA